ncbi:hypothetical protein VIAQ111709_13950 [Vibrio aquimaris]|uniref:Uncharacterized protein n=1 Tax=Vibrio aquimaris TaxID=2587862 RepID=A0A5P9CPE8_9VIBR|nr:hypothetical protein FIV01_14870 [Vibrio aquimaris]
MEYLVEENILDLEAIHGHLNSQHKPLGAGYSDY